MKDPQDRIAPRAIREDLRQYILSNHLPGEAEAALSNDDLLFEGGIIDSGGALALLAFLETRFQFKVSDQELFLENFATVDHIVRFILSKLQRESAGR